ncbi:hypothetical protein J9253_18550 [Thiothrix litoralis]|jgi:hypothetical protein|uniref:Uncharacterized protein n=1 Tax=Thiothrix litoralis TaxID=2891210 RepID=A0ABX7WS16_9GAMM|nr:hypothetical protein [Thiothrix litoralis]QTR45961.1 hypothetical protein J9253_18550 [Thiothrix litoralis]
MPTAVFIKTPKGVEEVETKANGLSMIQRWVLISIDGKRTFEDLKTLPRVNDLSGILVLLETGGYITPVKAPVNLAPPVANLSLFRALPATFDPKTFSMAKHFMINTLNAFKGPYDATSLVRNIDHCQTHEELRALFEQWHEEIGNTRQGQKQGKDLQKKLLDVL